MLRRRLVFHMLGSALAVPFASFAQQQSKVFKIGWLTFGSAESNKLLTDAFEEAMRKLGYVDGKNVSFDRGFADGNVDRLPALAAGLVQRDPDVLYVANNAGSIALKRATSTIPIVFATVNDPVAIGLAASLARPGGNATGVSTLAVELVAKRLQLLKEAFPQLSRVAVLIGPELPIVLRQ